jgi:hypothetical protein
MRQALPLLRNLEPLALVARCRACGHLAMAREICMSDLEVLWCTWPQREQVELEVTEVLTAAARKYAQASAQT